MLPSDDSNFVPGNLVKKWWIWSWWDPEQRSAIGSECCRYTIHMKETTSNEIHEACVQVLWYYNNAWWLHDTKSRQQPATYLGNEPPLQRRRQSSKGQGQGQGERGGDSWCWRSSIAVCCWCFVKFSVFVLWGKRMRKDWDQSSSCYIASYPALTENSLLFGTRDVDNNMRRMRVDSRLFI